MTVDKMPYRRIVECVACGSNDLRKILDLKTQPLANDYRIEKSDRQKFPLQLNLCLTCTHSQLSVSINQELLFVDYQYVSGTSETLSNYFNSLRDRIIQTHGEIGKLLDIGSNDGTFLEKFQGTKWRTIGVDPAVNLVPDAISRGVKTIPAFFTEDLTEFLAKDFDAVVAMNVFAHTSEPARILMGVSKILSSTGKLYIQTSQADMFINHEFDTVYHEHISFFNVRSMKALLSRTGWNLVDVEIVNIHGNSYLWKIEKSSNGGDQFSPREEFEKENGLYDQRTYDSFAAKVNSIVKGVLDIVESSRKQGYLVASYGAAAKGNTFLNYAEINLDFIFDDTPYKIGKYAPAGNNRVSSPTLMSSIEEKILFVIPAWNFKEEILGKIRHLRPNGKDLALAYFPKLNLSPIQ